MKRVVAIGVVGLLIGFGLPAEAGVPTDQLKSATDRVLKLLQDPELKKPEKTEERRKRIRGVADDIFDWQETGKRALARHWQPLTPQQRDEFSVLFADLVERSYIGKIEAYSGEKILYGGETLDGGGQAIVKTKLVTKSNTEIPIDYQMSKEGDRWRAYDVLIEGISLVANYRTQFNKIIAQSGYDELIKKMKSKQDELGTGRGAQGKKP
jgi:phospholipid transport system substrate-binding protein